MSRDPPRPSLIRKKKETTIEFFHPFPLESARDGAVRRGRRPGPPRPGRNRAETGARHRGSRRPDRVRSLEPAFAHALCARQIALKVRKDRTEQLELQCKPCLMMWIKPKTGLCLHVRVFRLTLALAKAST
ncbi:hypothetical protein EVAR_29948_1 [Eumeta japonica]|uniref:Uncharacterized protein n=1 Tax=Eumeta variegata TaxID=151549 RepID=A0A4C1VHI2_EUMVA|nr:hypothetical protein EVAR_29948_1 [Eumeta japonica]